MKKDIDSRCNYEYRAVRFRGLHKNALSHCKTHREVTTFIELQITHSAAPVLVSRVRIMTRLDRQSLDDS